MEVMANPKKNLRNRPLRKLPKKCRNLNRRRQQRKHYPLTAMM